MKCRHCKANLLLPLVDLGSAPPSNAYLTHKALSAPEKWFPLRVLICETCWLAQTEDFSKANELFDAEYAYFSGFSSTWLEHCRRYVVSMVERFQLDQGSLVVEVAANDGYLLQFFKQAGIPCLGIEPTASTAEAARAKGIDIIEDFFGRRLAERLVDAGTCADLLTAKNVLAHVPDINDFVSGFARLLKPQGVATFEFPHLLRLVDENQFDTIYHEHFSYLSLTSVDRILRSCGLEVFDVESHSTHGGSLRVFAQLKATGNRIRNSSVNEFLHTEKTKGLLSADYYREFQSRTDRLKNDLLEFLLRSKREGKTVGAYGAAAKGNTLLNYAGVRPDLIPFVVDRNPSKQGNWLPGSRIPIVPESHLSKAKPDYVLILPWNLRNEVVAQLSYTREWGARFVTAVPELRVH